MFSCHSIENSFKRPRGNPWTKTISRILTLRSTGKPLINYWSFQCTKSTKLKAFNFKCFLSRRLSTNNFLKKVGREVYILSKRDGKTGTPQIQLFPVDESFLVMAVTQSSWARNVLTTWGSWHLVDKSQYKVQINFCFLLAMYRFAPKPHYYVHLIYLGDSTEAYICSGFDR